VALVALLALVGASCKQLNEDNRAGPIFGASNGRLVSQWLTPAAPGCSVYWEATVSMQKMLSAAAHAGITITPSSCYRDFAGQVAARDSWCARGQCHMAAVPGTSNHGWGKAVDFREGRSPMTYDSPGYQWLLANAGLYGWLHPKAMKAGGPVPEPWHWEWVGDGGRMFPGEYFGIGNALPLSGSPIGNVDAVSASPGQIRVAGWALDPDQQDPIDVHVYIGPWWGGIHLADEPRPDVGAAFPAYASRPHGFDTTIPASPGTYDVCAFGINTSGPGANALLACRTVTVPEPANTTGETSDPVPAASPTTGPLPTTAAPEKRTSTPTSVAPPG